jgi:hypothetical protein
MFKWGLTLAVLAAAPAVADEGPSYRHHHSYGVSLPPGRHVVEVVQPPWSGNFIINGRRFVAKTDACNHWAAGERIKLLEGDWSGRCVEAVFYNVRRHSTCETWCRGW